jgi:hypothetical protein
MNNQHDILNIDLLVMNKFKMEESRLSSYKNCVDELKNMYTDNLSFRLQKNIQNKIQELTQKIQNIHNKTELNFYVHETSEILEKYKKILQTPLKISFMTKTQELSPEKDKLIESYVNIAKKYIDLDIEINKKNKDIICLICKNPNLDIIDNSIYICSECGNQQDVLINKSSYKDLDRINISVKYMYDRKIHFRDCINQYQGKQNCKIDKKVIEDLKDQLKKHNLLVDSDNDEIKFSNITKEHIYIFLKELNYSKHYENVNLIHNLITYKKLDNISHLEEKLLHDFDQLIDVYYTKFKHTKRKSFISTQYILYQLLVSYHHPCKKEEFAILKTLDRKSFHDEICKVCFEELGWNHTPLF